MPGKSKFKPEITRIKLHPEQAVLACPCHGAGHSQKWGPSVSQAGAGTTWTPICDVGNKNHHAYYCHTHWGIGRHNIAAGASSS